MAESNWSEIKKELKDDLKEIINLTSANTDQKLDTISESIKEIKSDMAEFKAAQKSDVAALEKRVEALEKKDGETAKKFLGKIGQSAVNYLIPILFSALGLGLLMMLIKK